ncbi:MAG: methylated-DNA--[protein]-cysteine S-methyltransferase [Ginsengibacter sp.]
MYYQSPIGTIIVNVQDEYISEINFTDQKVETKSAMPEKFSKKEKAILKECTRQLDEYFSGKRKTFDFPFRQSGTLFREKVWKELTNIPYGKTISYLQLSQRIGNEKAVRAVGTANGQNNLSIVVPCHRVIGSDGSLTGYGGGLWRKQWLLEHENKYANGVYLLF